MRDFTLSDIVFTSFEGKSYTIKEMRDYTLNSYQTWFIHELKTGEDLDEIASRRSVYGESSESEYYRIAENNMVDLFNNKFKLSRMKTLNIPMP